MDFHLGKPFSLALQGVDWAQISGLHGLNDQNNEEEGNSPDETATGQKNGLQM